jgi:hypothetical protein
MAGSIVPLPNSQFQGLIDEIKSKKSKVDEYEPLAGTECTII